MDDSEVVAALREYVDQLWSAIRKGVDFRTTESVAEELTGILEGEF